MKKKYPLLNEAGETIVEVMIAIAVLAFAVGGAFAIASRSKNTIQANQERYQAQLVANSQADSLKIYMDAIGSFSGRCIVNGQVANLEQDCKFDNGDNVDLYDVLITPKGMNIFVIKVSWASLINESSDQLELVYGTGS